MTLLIAFFIKNAFCQDISTNSIQRQDVNSLEPSDSNTISALSTENAELTEVTNQDTSNVTNLSTGILSTGSYQLTSSLNESSLTTPKIPSAASKIYFPALQIIFLLLTCIFYH